MIYLLFQLTRINFEQDSNHVWAGCEQSRLVLHLCLHWTNRLDQNFLFIVTLLPCWRLADIMFSMFTIFIIWWWWNGWNKRMNKVIGICCVGTMTFMASDSLPQNGTGQGWTGKDIQPWTSSTGTSLAGRLGSWEVEWRGCWGWGKGWKLVVSVSPVPEWHNILSPLVHWCSSPLGFVPVCQMASATVKTHPFCCSRREA